MKIIFVCVGAGCGEWRRVQQCPGRSLCFTQLHPHTENIHSQVLSRKQGITNRCCPSWLTNSTLVYEHKCGGRGELRSLSQCVKLYTGAQINFGDLTPY
jgi:hypothetical protein